MAKPATRRCLEAPSTPLTPPAAARRGRVAGTRVIIDFPPKLTSIERLCAGVVIRTAQGELSAHCSIDKRKAESAFGIAGAALYEMANALCESLLQHWAANPGPQTWKPPFEGAAIARIGDFTASSAQSEAAQTLKHHSTLGTLFSCCEINGAVPEKMEAPHG